MKHLALLLCAACLASTLVPVGAAQQRTTTASLASASQSEGEVKVETKYDRAKNETTVEFQQLDLGGNQSQRALLSVSASYPGQQKPKKPPEDIIVIISVVSARSYRFPDVMAMQVTADGKKLSPVIMLNLDKRRMDEDYLETIGTRMKYDLFKRLMQARAGEFQLSDLTLQLNESQIGLLRELDALLHQ